MGLRRLVRIYAAPLLLASAMASPTLFAQQQPIFGCRHAISCRTSPVGNSALNDGGTSGLLVGGSIRWGPGFHFDPVLPLQKLPTVQPAESIELHGFHLQNVTLLPTPEPASAPQPAPAPPPPAPTPAPRPD